jgi:dTDP-4-amino-4,6-dideoxygalactose transaminase
VHRQAAMREWGTGVELLGTEEAAARHLAIPMSPVLSAEQAREVTTAITAATS